jgi:hypothetical protein
MTNIIVGVVVFLALMLSAFKLVKKIRKSNKGSGCGCESD